MARKPVESESDIGGEEPGDLASVVLVEKRDDIASVCGKVDSAPTFAVVVHAPRGNRALSTELGMRRLERHGEESGRIVAIATRSGALAARARQCRIPVASRPEAVRWDSGGHKVLRFFGNHSVVLPSFGGAGQWIAVLVIAAVFGFLALTVAPAAEITVTPPMETLSKTVTITAASGRGDIDLVQLLVPARELSSSQKITLAIPTTGKALVPTQPAKVAVVITNPGAKEITVPARAILLGPGNATFALDEDTVVGPGKAAPASATCTQPGKSGNVGPNTVKSFQDPALKDLPVNNATAAQGGLDEERPAVDARDLASLKALAASLEKSETIKARVLEDRPHDAVFLKTAKTVVSSGELSAAVGAPADVVLVDVRVSVTALAIPQETLEKVARGVLLQGRGPGELVAGTVSAKETGARQVNADDGTVRTELLLSGQFVRNVTRDGLRKAVKGKSEDDARSTLARQYGIQDADVSLSPGWAPWLPRFDFRIDVSYRSPAPTSPAGVKAEAPSANGTPVPTVTPATPRP